MLKQVSRGGVLGFKIGYRLYLRPFASDLARLYQRVDRTLCLRSIAFVEALTNDKKCLVTL